MRTLVVPVLLFLATVSFGFGLVLPIAVFKKLVMFSEHPSIVQVIAGLWNDGSVWIASVLALFSIAFPAGKLAVLHIAAYAPERAHWVKRVGALSKWSMADVLVVALVIFAAKTSGLATAATQAGIWFYGAATVLSAGAAYLLTREASKAA